MGTVQTGHPVRIADTADMDFPMEERGNVNLGRKSGNAEHVFFSADVFINARSG